MTALKIKIPRQDPKPKSLELIRQAGKLGAFPSPSTPITNDLKVMIVLLNAYEFICRKLTGLYCVCQRNKEFKEVIDLIADNAGRPESGRQTMDQTGDSRAERTCPPPREYVHSHLRLQPEGYSVGRFLSLGTT